jgi:VWFA-related protein
MSTRSNFVRLLIIFVIFVILATARGPWAISGQAPQSTQPPSTQAQQRPVFRGGTHFVRVDAYPVDNGKIVEGLTPEDFQVLEDDKPQTIDSFDFVSFETFTPEAARQEPRSQEEGFALAADPRNRVFVIVVDIPRSGTIDIHQIQQPLISFLDRLMGPMDLFGFLTTHNTARDLVLARKTTAVETQIADLFRSANIDRDEADDLDACGNGATALKGVFRDDQTYTALETLVTQLGAIREERKSVVFVANSITRSKGALKGLAQNQGRIPGVGITNGKVGIGDHSGVGVANDTWCNGEVQRLSSMDFDQRYRTLIDEARYQNVGFYTITPEGISVAHPPDPNIIALADETGGIAIVNTNDLNGGMKRIAADLQAYYVLGYYTTNTKFDGGVRKITVKLKGKPIRARRQYRAPTEAEIAMLAQHTSAPPAAMAPASGPPAVIGEPAAYRVSRTQPPERVKLLEFVRSDRIRIEWPVLAALDRREARMLDTAGKPLPFDLPVSEAPDGKSLVVELPLAPFGRGGYSIELTAASGGRTERRRLTIIMK